MVVNNGCSQISRHYFKVILYLTQQNNREILILLMQNLYHKMTKTQSRSENLIKYSCLFASWIVLFHKKQLTRA